MRVWRLDIYPGVTHTDAVEYFTSQRAAKKRLVEFKREVESTLTMGPNGDTRFSQMEEEFEPYPLDIPINKAGLIKWLNVWAATPDSGDS